MNQSTEMSRKVGRGVLRISPPVNPDPITTIINTSFHVWGLFHKGLTLANCGMQTTPIGVSMVTANVRAPQSRNSQVWNWNRPQTLTEVFIINVKNIYRHMKAASTIANLSNLKNEWSLLLTVTIQGISPLLNCVFTVIKQITRTLFPSVTIFTYPILVFGVSIDIPYIIHILFMWNPVFDALLTIFCVNRYRRVVFGWFSRKSPQVNPIEPLPLRHGQFRNTHILAQWTSLKIFF
jgi:hypothetical protein